jgi:hypothetical protein
MKRAHRLLHAGDLRAGADVHLGDLSGPYKPVTIMVCALVYALRLPDSAILSK